MVERIVPPPSKSGSVEGKLQTRLALLTFLHLLEELPVSGRELVMRGLQVRERAPYI
jgi:hypothetical protein